MTSHDYMLELMSGWRRKFTPDELGMLAEQLKQLVRLAKEDRVSEMKFEYLQVYLEDEGKYVAFDGNSICDGDNYLLPLLNRLGQDRWEHSQYIKYELEGYYHLLKRSLS